MKNGKTTKLKSGRIFIPAIAIEWSEPKAALLITIPSKLSTLVGRRTAFADPVRQYNYKDISSCSIDLFFKITRTHNNKITNEKLPANFEH